MGENRSTTVSFRIDEDVKKAADTVFQKLGIPASVAINMFYKQCIINEGIPFPISTNKSGITKAEVSVEKKERERVLPLFLDYTGTTDHLLEGGAENVKEFFEAIIKMQEELNIKINITIVTGSDRETAKSKFQLLKNLADNYGLTGLFDGVVAEYCGVLIRENESYELLPMDRRLEQRKQQIIQMAAPYGGTINENNTSYYNVRFPETISEVELIRFRDDINQMFSSTSIEADYYFDDYGREVDIKPKEQAKYRAVAMTVDHLCESYDVPYVIVGGDSQDEDLMMYTENKERFEAMNIGCAFICPSTIGELADSDENIKVASWENAKGITECICALTPTLKGKLMVR